MLLSLISTLDRMQQNYFHGFFEEQDPLLFRYAVYLMRDHHQAEEALQNAWLQCLSNRETFFAIPENIRPAWMRSVLRNAAHDLYRQARRFVPLDDDWDAPAPDPGDTDGIVSIIRSMPEQYRQVLELKFLLEWSDEMIAQKLGLTLNATYTRISRGKKLLRERLIQEGYADETNRRVF